MLPAPAPAQDAAAGEPERRIALVLGNNAYRGAPLTGPINDARAMADALVELGFTVVKLEDVGRDEMLQAIKRFVEALGRSESVGLFYFAGQGAQANGKNFLIPVDADIRQERDIEVQGVDLQYMLDKFGAMRSGMNILILDACRDNPLVPPGARGGAGLAAIDGPPGTLVAFAAAPGHVAQERSNANGIYTRNVLANIRTPGLPVEEVFRRIRSGVLAETDRHQMPWENASLVRDFYFKGAPSGRGYRPQRTDSEGDAWVAIYGSRNLYDFIGFLRRFPGTRHRSELLVRVNAALARLKPAPPALEASELPSLLGEAYLGFVTRPINSYSAASLGLSTTRAVIVTDVDPGSVAQQSGLLPGDVLLRVNGVAVENYDEALTLSHRLHPGELVDVVVWRQRHEVKVSGVLTRAPLERLLTRVADDQVKRSNFERARAFYEYLAEGGYGLGQWDLGMVYLQGIGVKPDPRLAESWLRKAALQGEPTPAAYLAGLYLNPESGLKNDKEAFHWAKISAEAGVPEGATVLALAYFRGAGTDRNPAEAVRWARLAADQGEPTAMFMLGAAYETGLSGVERDPGLARLWYRRARELGSAPAKAALLRLGEP